MCGPQVRFCERRRGASPFAYSTVFAVEATLGCRVRLNAFVCALLVIGQSPKLIENFVNCIMGKDAAKRGVSGFPIQTFNLISQDNAVDLISMRNFDLKWVAFDMARDRTKKCQPNFTIVRFRRQNQCGTMT